MHLLKLNCDGKPSPTRFTAGNIPSYAILSHTWEADDQEVTFKDLTDGVGIGKVGYRKIRFCGEQARKDGLQYFWVDSCCIDKSSSAELQEAINSMFGWYQNAAKCYVYLSDISTGKHSRSSQLLWHVAFTQSRWFTRGWTLQELLAPSSVEFFSREGKRLGDKKSLEVQIQQATGIAIQALQGTSLSEFSVDERMSWAAKRETTIEEDQAYCLLGIFDTHLPLIYGEGKENAFRRLRKEILGFGDDSLSRLPYAVEAPFNSNQRQHEPTCLPKTRVDLVREIYNWADGQDERTIFWLNGLAGTGKSTIARTVARRYFDQRRLGASFFFSRGGGDAGHAGKFVTSIALQLANSISSLHQHICDAITERRDITSQSLRDQWQQLVLRPLSKLGENGCQSSYVLVVDALDECDNDNDIRIIIHLLAEAQLLKTFRLRVFLTSRPEIPIRYEFYQIPDVEHQDFVLHNISPSIVDRDISIFFKYNLRLIGQEHSLDARWPGEEIIRRLVQISSGLFIWAATACRFIREGKRFSAKRLDTIVQSSINSVTAPEKHLNEIYIAVLKNSISTDYTDEEKEEAYHMLRQILGSIVILFSPLSAYSLSKLLHVTKKDIDQTLEDLHSILNVPGDLKQPLHLHHPSFRDFLLDIDRCKDPNFRVDEKRAHQILADGCIRLMSTSLKQDICGLDAPGMLVADVKRSQVERSLPPEVQYACLYWIQHLQKSGGQFRDNGQAHQFLQEHLLHWLEALGWMGKIPEGVHAVASLESVASSTDSPCFSTFIYDTKRFILYNRPAIEQAPLQTYYSALVFTPTTSIIKEKFKNCIPRWIRRLPRVDKNWNAVLQTLEGHSDSVNAVAFSSDGKTLMSASVDRTVKLWDSGSGAILQTLEGYSGWLRTLAFSSDGKTLVSASYDYMIKLWDVSSKTVLRAIKPYLGIVVAMALSRDGKTLAVASSDGTVELCDVSSGRVLHTFRDRFGQVWAVAFSPDGKTLVWASTQTVKILDISSGAVLRTLEGHSDGASALAFSPDGKTLASAFHYGTIKLCDASSGTVLQTFEGHLGSISAVTFTPDGKTLASANDRMVKLWDIGSKTVLQAAKDRSGEVNAISFSPGGKMLVSASDDTVKLWDVSSGRVLYTLEGGWNFVSAVVFSPDGKMLASALDDGTVELWDAGSGAFLQTLDCRSLSALRMLEEEGGVDGHLLWVNAVVFSPDSKVLASASGDTVKLWDVSSGLVLQTFKDHSGRVNAMAFSLDSKTLASAFRDGTIKLCDASSGAVLQTFEGLLGSIAVAFSPDGKMLASASDCTVKLWDTGSGAVLHTLDIGAVVTALSFSDDGASLQTNWGSLPISLSLSDGTTVSQPHVSPLIFVKDQWMSRNTERILWIPPEYRPTCTVVCGSTIGLGCMSGRVAIMEFAF